MGPLRPALTPAAAIPSRHGRETDVACGRIETPLAGRHTERSGTGVMMRRDTRAATFVIRHAQFGKRVSPGLQLKKPPDGAIAAVARRLVRRRRIIVR